MWKSKIKWLILILLIVGYVFYVYKAMVDTSIVLTFPHNYAKALKSMVYHYGLVVLIPLLFLKSIDVKFFSWKVWLAPTVALVAVASFCWAVGGWYFVPYLYGLRWGNVAVISWITLFTCSLFLYQRQGVSLNDSFVAAFASVTLASWIYELFDPRIGLFGYFNQPTVYASIGVLGFMAYRYKFKLDKWVWVTLYFLLLAQTVYFTHYVNVWIDALLRFIPFPFFLYYATRLNIKSDV